MFRRAPSAPHPHADLLSRNSEQTEVFDRVPAVTEQMPPVSDDPPTAEISLTTGPSTVIYSAVEMGHQEPARDDTLETPRGVPDPPRVSHGVPERRTASPRVSRRPRTTMTWSETLRDVAHDPKTVTYVLLIALAAVLVAWGTTVALKPEWVPAPVNPRQVVTEPERPEPTEQVPSYSPPRKQTRRVQPVPTEPERKPQPSQTPSEAPTEAPQTPDPTLPGTPGPSSPPAPSEGPSQTPPTDPPPTDPSPPTEGPKPPTKNPEPSVSATQSQSQAPSQEPTTAEPESPQVPSPSSS